MHCLTCASIFTARETSKRTQFSKGVNSASRKVWFSCSRKLWVKLVEPDSAAGVFELLWLMSLALSLSCTLQLCAQELFTTVYIGFLILISTAFLMYLAEKDYPTSKFQNFAGTPSIADDLQPGPFHTFGGTLHVRNVSTLFAPVCGLCFLSFIFKLPTHVIFIIASLSWVHNLTYFHPNSARSSTWVICALSEFPNGLLHSDWLIFLLLHSDWLIFLLLLLPRCFVVGCDYVVHCWLRWHGAANAGWKNHSVGLRSGGHFILCTSCWHSRLWLRSQSAATSATEASDPTTWPCRCSYSSVLVSFTTIFTSCTSTSLVKFNLKFLTFDRAALCRLSQYCFPSISNFTVFF